MSRPLAEIPDGLLTWFEEAQGMGLLGPAPIAEHLAHTTRFIDALGTGVCGRVLDLGTGAGLPGLVLACWWPQTTWVLLDGKEKRASLLRQTVWNLGWDDRIEVRWGRAESLAHERVLRERFALVVARLFGPPAVVAECASGFLMVGGQLAVSEPPGGASRWPAASVEQLGLQVGELRASIQVLQKARALSSGLPRREGMPTKRPLF